MVAQYFHTYRDQSWFRVPLLTTELNASRLSFGNPERVWLRHAIAMSTGVAGVLPRIGSGKFRFVNRMVLLEPSWCYATPYTGSLEGPSTSSID